MKLDTSLLKIPNPKERSMESNTSYPGLDLKEQTNFYLAVRFEIMGTTNIY